MVSIQQLTMINVLSSDYYSFVLNGVMMCISFTKLVCLLTCNGVTLQREIQYF